MRNEILILLLLLVGCTTPQECPTIVCDTEETEQEVEEVRVIDYIKENGYAIIIENDNVHLLNCGSAAYGLVAVDDMVFYERTYVLGNLYINESHNIGGCIDVLRHLHFEEIHIHIEDPGTAEYDNMLRWIPPSRLNHHSEVFDYRNI